MNLPSDGWISVWNNTAKQWSNAVVAASATNAQPPSTILTNLSQTGAITNIPSSKTLWVDTGGSDSTGTRGRIDKPFLTPFAAKTAASAGDLIILNRGIYSTGVTNLLKDQVNWWGDGASLSNNINADVGIFDNTFEGNSGVVRCSIGGDIELITTPLITLGGIPFRGIVTVSNASSIIYLKTKRIANIGGNQNAGIRVLGGTIIFDVDKFDFGAGGAALYWGEGDQNCYGTFKHIDSATDSPIWVEGAGAGNWYLNGQLVESVVSGASAAGTVYFKPTNPLAKLWLNVEEIYGGSVAAGYGGCLTVSTGKLYVAYQKMSAVEDTSTPRALIEQDSGELWLNGMKMSLTNNQRFVNQTGGKMWVQNQTYEDNGIGSSTRPFNYQVTGGTNTIQGGDWITKWGPGLKLTGGLTVLDGVSIDTTASSNPTNYAVWLSGGTVEVRGGPRLNAGGTNSIFAASAQAGNSYGGFLSNKRPTSNITWSKGTNYNDYSFGDSIYVRQDVNVGGDLNVAVTLNGVNGVFSGDVFVTDDPYGAGWDGSTAVPTKNAVYDKIQTIVSGAATVDPITNRFAAANTFTNLALLRQEGGLRRPNLTASRVMFVNAQGDETNVTSASASTDFVHADGSVAVPTASAAGTQDGQIQFKNGTSLDATNDAVLRRGTASGTPYFYIVSGVNGNSNRLSSASLVAMGASSALYLGNNGGTNWGIESSGAFAPFATDVYDIGSPLQYSRSNYFGVSRIRIAQVDTNLVTAWKVIVASSISASAGDYQVFNLGSNTNLNYVPLVGQESNSVTTVQFVQNSTGGFYPTNNGNAIPVWTNANKVSFVTYSIINGQTNVFYSPPLTVSLDATNLAPMIYDRVNNSLTNAAFTGTGGIVKNTSPAITTPTITSQSEIGFASVNSEVVTNSIGFVNQTVAGVGGANTNFTFLATNAVTYVNAGLTNVNIVAIMPGISGITYFPTIILSNLTTTARNVSISRVTNSVINLQQYDSVSDPYTVTNKHTAILSVMANGTNLMVAFKQATNNF